MTLRLLLLGILTTILTGCQAGYLLENAYYQADLLLRRVPNQEALKNPELTPEQRRKISLAEEARIFSEKHLGLQKSENYTQYAQLDGRYIVHSLTVAPKNELKPYQWWFPLFGRFPYLGYYNRRSAELAQQRYKEGGYDTYLRGVSAFSSLGWFKDPILSSMLRYSDYDLVNLIIHETVHATVYIKNAVDFNERLAVFVGNLGTEKFYLAREGADSATLLQAQADNEDDKVFSKFISHELKELKQWYVDHKDKELSEEEREQRFQQIRDNFKANAWPQMKTKNYHWFSKARLNNARLLNYRTYFRDLSDFEKIYEKLGKDFSRLIRYCRSLESVADAEKKLASDVNDDSFEFL